MAQLRSAPLQALLLGVVLLLGLVAGVVVFAYDTGANSRAQIRLSQASVELNLLFSDLQDAETGQRGYLLTGNATYLAPYTAAIMDVPQRTAAFKAVLADDVGQQMDFATLQPLIAAKLDELRQTIDLAQAGKQDEALAIVNDDNGRQTMNGIRAVVDRMRGRQAGWLDDASANVQRDGQRLEFGVAGVALGVLLLGSYAFAAQRRQRLMAERNAATVAAHAAQVREAHRLLTEEMQSRQQAEEQMRQMQKIEAVGQLTGGIAHDFNNMLAVVLSAVSLARRRLGAEAAGVATYLDAATDAANRAASLTNRLLAFSRQQPLAPEPIDANKMVSDTTEILRRTLGGTVVLETVLAGGLWRIFADPVQLESSVINLAVNARDAMPGGGRITIETANVALDEHYAEQNSGVNPGQYVMVAVSDTGAGMTAEVMAKAFDPFFTTKPVGKGTGLGLSQVHGFVKQSNGHIKLYSEPGHGTTVKLYLPRHFASAAAAEKAAARKTAVANGAAGRLILLVEDEERVRLLSADALREIGYRVIAADGGKAALGLLEEHPDVALLFTDIVMPEMNGRALADAATKLRPGLKVLYTTGFTRNAVVHNGVLDPGVNFIAKPFTIEDLAAKLRTVLDG